jgi:hypothetical protein
LPDSACEYRCLQRKDKTTGTTDLALADPGERLAVVGAAEGRVAAEQDVRDDADAPHVCAEGHALATCHFGRHELGHAEVQCGVLAELDATRQPEVTDLQLVAARVRQ